MLIIYFHNDGTGDWVVGNYKWAVCINSTLLAHGKLKGHKRGTLWKGLVRDFAKSIEVKRGKKK
jgi:hypothetical protein